MPGIPVPEPRPTESQPTSHPRKLRSDSVEPGIETFSFPLSPKKWVKVELPCPLTEKEWKRMIENLDIFKPGFTVESEEEDD